ncbi:MAG: hypothetical protein E6J15_03950 [Chloroflexi bacterium]|nr:MAG: hypothetical protein E6J15_03950 [Chloroflexota bacterium]
MNSGLVRYACRAAVHLGPRNRDGAAGNPVTIYEGAWAYCPIGALTEHVWEAIEPVSLTDLKLIEIIVRPREAAPRTREVRA